MGHLNRRRESVLLLAWSAFTFGVKHRVNDPLMSDEVPISAECLWAFPAGKRLQPKMMLCMFDRLVFSGVAKVRAEETAIVHRTDATTVTLFRLWEFRDKEQPRQLMIGWLVVQ